MNSVAINTGRLACAALLAAFWGLGATAQTTALDDYVNTPDAVYGWTLENTVAGTGFTDYVLRLTSQAWLTTAEVDEPVWEHWLILTVPDTVTSTTGLLQIHHGNASQTLPGGNIQFLRDVALSSQTVTARLRQVPNQPLDLGAGPMSEDAQIAFAWRQFLETGEEKWLSRLPMTKSAVRAMDAVTEFMASPAGGQINVSDFVVMGESKRGWTTWTTAAVDSRVVAIAPLVIDLLNIDPSFRHHYWALGRYAPAIQNYVDEDIPSWMGNTPEWQALVDIVEPFSYRDRLDMPKYIVNATQDQFFLPDSSQFYFDQLQDEKLLRYVPNAGHSVSSTVAFDDVETWYWTIINNVPRPEIKWKKEDTGELVIETVSGTPDTVLLWEATNPNARDFNIDNIGAAYTSSVLTESEPGKYIASVPDPANGWTAFFVEFQYDVGGPSPLHLTTEVSVVPDVLPFGPRYKLGPATEVVAPDFYTSAPNGMGAFWGALNNAGTTIAFYGVDLDTFDTEIYLVDRGKPESWRQLTMGFPGVPNTLIAWSPDDSHLFIASRRINAVTGVMDQPQYFGLTLDDPVATARPTDNYLIIHRGVSHIGGNARNLIALPIHPNGDPDTARDPVALTNFDAGETRGRVDWPTITPDGKRVAFMDYAGSGTVGVPDIGDIYILDEIDEILAAPTIQGTIFSSMAPTKLDDPRIMSVRTGGVSLDNFTATPAFSQDGSVLFYSEDWNNVFRDADFFNSVADGDWDLMASRTDGVGGDVRLDSPGSQIVPIPTRGGTRILYGATINDPLDFHLFITTLEVTTPINGNVVGDPADNNIETFQSQRTQDGSGTSVAIPAGTTIDFPPGEEQEVVIQTPIDPIDEPALPPGNEFALPVVRTFGPAGTTFTPPIIITITYSDEEVADIPDEEQIEVFLYNEATGVFDIPVTVTHRDTDNNTISFEVDHFSTFGLGAETDSSGNGIPDVWLIQHGFDPNDFDIAFEDTDGDGLTNLEEYLHGTDPNNPDTSGNGIPDGWLVQHGLNPLLFIVANQDNDGDGFTNLEEYEAGSDPNDPESTPLTVNPLLPFPEAPPGTPVGGAVVAAGLLALLSAAAIRRRRR